MSSVLFLGALIAGLLVAVFAMLHGVERRAPGQTELVSPRPPQEMTARLNVPAIAGFLLFFGAVGYPLGRTALAPGARLALAVVAGAVGVVAALLLVARWAVPSAREEVVDERFLLMGHLGRVVTAIPEGGEGEIAYEVEGRDFRCRATGLEGAAIDAGADVVIERIEGDLAVVEAWAQVEKRL